jgi:hypothetical protein
MPTDLAAVQGSVVTVPISIDHLFDSNGHQGLSAFDLELTFDPNVFTVTPTDVSQGSLLTNPPPNGTWHLEPIADTPGAVFLSGDFSSPAEIVTSQTGGVLANINFHINGSASIGNSTIHVVVPPQTGPDGFSSGAFYLFPGLGGVNNLYANLNSADQIDGVVNVVSSAATHFSISAPSSATAGDAFNFTVTALTALNTTATGYSGTVHFTSSDGNPSLPSDVTLVNGIGTFSATLTTASSQTITATDQADNSITGASNSIAVNAAAATHFAMSAPSSATAGTAFNFTVTAQDQFKNTDTSYGGIVHYTSSDGNASLPADSTLTNGTGTFSATLTTAGSQTITSTDTVNSSITGTSNAISVSSAAATHFAVSAPSSVTEGGAFNFTVTAQDQFNNTATGYGGTVHYTSSDTTAFLPVNSTLTNGTGTFSAALNEESSQTITATDTVMSGVTGISNTTTVADASLGAGALTPPNASAGAGFSNVTIFHFTDADPNGTASDFSAKVTLGDGNTVTLTSTPSTNGQIVANAGGFDVQLSYMYNTVFSGQTFAVNVTDVGGQTTGKSINNFSIGFVDNFTVNGPLSPLWTVQAGNFLVNSGLAGGTATSTTSPPAPNVATVNNFTAVNTIVQADMNLTGPQQYAGLVSRYSGPGDTNMYWAGLSNYVTGQNLAEIWVYAGGVWSRVSYQSVGSSGGTLRLETAGTSLKLFLNNNLVGYTNDVAQTGGTVGMRSSHGATLAHFSANVLSLTNNSLQFNDNFAFNPNEQLSNNWLNQQGNFHVDSFQAGPGLGFIGVATGLGSLDVATVNGINSANVFVQTDANVSAGQYGGLVARYGGPLDNNMDWAGLVNMGTLQAQIWQNVNGTWTELFAQNVSSGNGTLRFEAVGTSLKLFQNNNLVAYANDKVLTGGTLGIRSSAGAAFGSFNADVLTLSSPGLPFSDSLNANPTNQQLSGSWLNQAGNFREAGVVATALGGADVATVNGVSVLNSTLQASVTVNVGQVAGLVSRYSGPGDSNMYWACVEGIGSNQAVAMIFVNKNGTWQQLPTFATVSFTAGTGTLKLVTFGNSLTLYVNGVSTLSVLDSSLLSAGTVGIRATQGAIIDNFSATSP